MITIKHLQMNQVLVLDNPYGLSNAKILGLKNQLSK